ncbi:invasion associated locus B family protein [Afifella pfennigii]|uniref:invasion associated locus B family protein n=1 Tax=Afifella pfennigii TaxID=209897 RepID=UPI00047AB6C0|nr:invasion associated locus B family protein [Afifella pfennigii]
MLRTLLTSAFLLAATTAFAQTPNSLGQFNDWTAWSYPGENGTVCFIHSVPKREMPSDLNHGKVAFFVRTSPSENISNEANFVVGYPFEEKSTVTVDIDGKKFTMFTKGDSAWLLNAAEEPELFAAMKAGKSMKISGKSRRGNETTYEYSLSGVTAASNKVSATCN